MSISRIAIFGVVIVAVVAAAFLLRALAENGGREAGAPLQVDELAENPDRFADQTVTVQGVVSAVVPEQGYFAIIDQAEYDDCKVVTCALYQIPVAFSGGLPELEQAVAVTGQLAEAEPGRFVVQATGVERLQ